MRRVTATVLLLLFLLNTIGYYGVFMGLKYQLEQTAVNQLDDDAYSKEELVEFKVSVSLPYMPDQKYYERVDGLIQIEGNYYRLVKQRYAGDTLYLVCMRDFSQEKLHEAIEDYVNTFTLPDASKSKQLDFSKSLSKDYFPSHTDFLELHLGFFQLTHHSSYVVSYTSVDLPTISPPPKHIA